MIEFTNNIVVNKISIKNILKQINSFYLYDYKKIIYNIYIINKLNLYCFFSMKSNDNLYLLKIINNTINKFDIVSIGELKKIILISKQKPYIIFSGSGKTLVELFFSVKLNIFCINVESFQEIFKIYYIMNILKKNINIMIRINPNIDAKTHEKITTGKKINKFGILISNIKNFFIISKILKINIIGYDFHIGSQIEILSPIKKLLHLIYILYKFKKFQYLDLGGGIGVNYYKTKNIIKIKNFYNNIRYLLKKKKINSKLLIEIGRYFFCNTCTLVSKINYIKYNINISICIVSTGMNDILRPSLYNSYHKIESYNLGKNFFNFFGPICESSDKYINDNNIKVKNNSLFILHSSGSYCKVLSNNYNSKNKIFEIIAYNNKLKIIFKLEKFKNLINNYE
ncbi:diaminopimelate decarboxylase family protein [Candidatus Carsonella ruddii]|uniref:diaminopimelate decarboxylase family protein n=1 Tax=Carsonella ruddii TaxID=114186 RepID=UPI003D815283